jgi:hypothetical protein
VIKNTPSKSQFVFALCAAAGPTAVLLLYRRRRHASFSLTSFCLYYQTRRFFKQVFISALFVRRYLFEQIYRTLFSLS